MALSQYTAQWSAMQITPLTKTRTRLVPLILWHLPSQRRCRRYFHHRQLSILRTRLSGRSTKEPVSCPPQHVSLSGAGAWRAGPPFRPAATCCNSHKHGPLRNVRIVEMSEGVPPSNSVHLSALLIASSSAPPHGAPRSAPFFCK